MRLTLNQDELEFRTMVDAWVQKNLPDDLREMVRVGEHLTRKEFSRWCRILDANGWSVPAWPKEYGGTGWSPLRRHLFEEQLLLSGAPRNTAAGIAMLGPILIAFGTQEQKDRYLPPIRRGETYWAQGFSEPGSGSDLATLRTTAVRDGSHFIVNGHKIWTSYAQSSEMMFALVRTNPEAKPQQGISFLLIDMASPGVKVRPIRMVDGGTDLNEVFLDDVRVPVENLIGEVDRGWDYAKHLLGFERTGIAGVAATKQQFARLQRLMATRRISDAFRRKMARAEIDLLAMDALILRTLTENPASRPGPEASMLKIQGTRVRQNVQRLLMELAGLEGLRNFDDPGEAVERDLQWLAANYLDSRKVSIYGGTNEIQANVVAKAVLGL
jgi:alkylation response protein AidB-like acyl-CoA dehydrogenase